jgi:hypothetical protein
VTRLRLTVLDPTVKVVDPSGKLLFNTPCRISADKPKGLVKKEMSQKSQLCADDRRDRAYRGEEARVAPAKLRPAPTPGTGPSAGSSYQAPADSPPSVRPRSRPLFLLLPGDGSCQ